MNDQRPSEPDLWDDDDEDNEQTQVAPNPLLRGGLPPSGITPVSGMMRRHVSSFGPPAKVPGAPSTERKSLYDRLLESGALDDVLATAAEEAAREPVELSRLDQKPSPTSEQNVSELAEELEPVRESRESIEELRDSDIDLVQRDSDGFVRALDRDPEEEVPPLPLVAKAKAPPLRAPARAPLPSVVLGPQLSTRGDATERVSVMPRTHPLANSMAPTASLKTEPPPPRRARVTPWLLGAAAAAAIVGLAVNVARVDRDAASSEPTRSAAAAPSRPVVEPSEKVVTPMPVAPAPTPASTVSAPAEATPAPAEPATAASISGKAAESDAARADETEAREPSERELRRRARREAAIAAAAQADATKPAQAEGTPATPAPAATGKRDASDPNLPQQPSREQVVQAMNAVLPRVQECVGDKHGTATVTLTVRSAGFVSYAIVGGTFAGTAEGSCIARVVKEASFPAFGEPFIRITYPFQL